MTEPTSHADIVDELAEEFLTRYRRGDHPPLSEYVQRCPERASEILDLFPALIMMEQASPAAESVSHSASFEEPQLHQLGDFRIVREVGRGGMGIVYEAEQVSLGRQVALKVLPRTLLTDSKHAKRFEREAKAAARLHHTNIVPVFGVGEQEGLHYYVMQFIHGLGLDEVLTELRRLRADSEAGKVTTNPLTHARVAKEVVAAQVVQSLLTGHFDRTVLVGEGSESSEMSSGERVADPVLPQPSTPNSPPVPPDTAVGQLSETAHHSFALPGQTTETHVPSRKVYWESVARMGVQTGQALQHAHDQGIIHRDIKPANLLLDTRGQIWVTDFGLAKAADQQDLTQTGDVLGTLRYMAPEQFDGKADKRSDVYSLGLTLYELLALKPAFEETDRHRLIKQVTTGTPPRLRMLDPHIPRDLETIVHKAIDREPSHRYQTAGEMADDLQRYLGDEPIQAKWVSPVTRFRRWCKRNPMGAAVAVLMALLAVGGPIMAATQIRLRREAAAAAADATEQQAEAIRQTRLALANEQEANEQRRRAEENLRKAREAVDRLFTRAAEDLSDEPHMEHIRRELLEDALEFYQGFMQQQSDDPVIRLETAYAYDRVGTIHQLLGDTVKELENRRQYHRLLEELREDYPADPQYRELLARSHVAIEDTLRRRGSVEKALEHGRQALSEWQSLAADFPTKPSYRREIIVWYVDSCSSATYWGNVPDEEQEARLHQALRMLDQFDADFPQSGPPKFLRFLANKRVADLLVRQARFGEAPEFRKAAWAALGKEPPAFSVGSHAVIVHDQEEAEGQLREEIARFEKAYADFPDVAENALQLAKQYAYLASLLTAQDRFEEAEVFRRQSRELHQSWLERFPKDPLQRMGVAWSSYDLGLVLQVNGKLQEASAMFRVAFRILRELADEYPDVCRHQNHYAWTLATCPAIEFRDPELSLRYAKRAVQLSPQGADFWFNLGLAQYRMGDFADAIKSIERGRKFAKGGASLEAALVQAMAWRQQGDVQKAVEFYQQAVKDAAEAPLLNTTTVDYRVLRAETDQLFAPADEKTNSHGDDAQRPPAPPETEPTEQIEDNASD